MNCRRFQNLKLEYVDGTLSAGSRARAERHLSGCAKCRQDLHRDLALTQSLSALLRQSTEPLALTPDVQRRMLRAIKQSGSTKRPVAWRPFPWAQAIAVALLIATFLIGAVLYNQRDGTRLSLNERTQTTVSIEASYLVPAYTFRQEGSSVIDTLAYETNEVNVTLWMGDNWKLDVKKAGTQKL